MAATSSRMLVAALLFASAVIAAARETPVEGACTLQEQEKYSGKHGDDAQALLSVGSGASAGAGAREEDVFVANEQVVELTTENFRDHVHPINQYTVVNVFAPWCPVSKAFDPLYKELANKTSERADVKFAMLNGDNDIAMRHRMKIQSYPTMIVFKKGFNPTANDLSKEYTVFEGKRTMTDMQEWVAESAPTGATLESRKKIADKKKELNKNLN